MTSQLANRISCSKSSLCSGCDHIDLDRAKLKELRFKTLSDLGVLPATDDGSVELTYEWIGAGGLRDRLEFTVDIESPGVARLGLFEKRSSPPEQHPSNERPRIVDIDECPQLSPDLQSWLTEFRRDLPPVTKRGSVRLRISPSGLRGVWLDFSNEDIKAVLDEGQWLERQLQRGIIVEMGQKRKRVEASPEAKRAHRLVDPKLEPWFETSLESGTAPVFGTIGTFTQAGFQTNRVLAQTVLKFAGPAKNLVVAEFGSGSGSFTLPLLAAGATTHVFESDMLALASLSKGVATTKSIDPKKLKIHSGDFILSAKSITTSIETPDFPNQFDVVIVDPPRPGLGHFATKISQHAKKARWIYVSCFPESFARDLETLKALGFKMDRLAVVEQFPFTRHFEIVASLRPNIDSNFT